MFHCYSQDCDYAASLMVPGVLLCNIPNIVYCLFQDLKNQILTTNLWVETVRRKSHSKVMLIQYLVVKLLLSFKAC